MSTEHFFALTPDRVLSAVEAGGVPCTGLCYPLNSLENRVYELEREDRTRVVAKFYRPGRWSPEAILDEHRFLADLTENEIPVAAPLPFPDGSTLRAVTGTGILYALFPRVGGRCPDELDDAQLRRLGALLGRIHNVGALRPAPHRRVIDARGWGEESVAVLRDAPTLPATLRAALVDVSERLLDAVSPLFEGVPVHRVHGDCHLGNLVWGGEGPFFLDFDDMAVGPAAQDVWLLAAAHDAEGARQRELLVEGYERFREFPRGSLALVEPLRALRYLHYAAWVTRRWGDPSFPRAFPHYGSERYWAELVDDLEEQIARSGGGAPVAKPGAKAPSGVTLREVSYDGDQFQRVLMVRDEVFVEEMGGDPTEPLDGLDPGALHLAAFDPDGRIAGSVRVTLRDGVPSVSHLAVLPHRRRRGVGTLLLTAALDRTRAMGLSIH